MYMNIYNNSADCISNYKIPGSFIQNRLSALHCTVFAGHQVLICCVHRVVCIFCVCFVSDANVIMHYSGLLDILKIDYSDPSYLQNARNIYKNWQHFATVTATYITLVLKDSVGAGFVHCINFSYI